MVSDPPTRQNHTHMATSGAQKTPSMINLSSSMLQPSIFWASEQIYIFIFFFAPARVLQEEGEHRTEHTFFSPTVLALMFLEREKGSSIIQRSAPSLLCVLASHDWLMCTTLKYAFVHLLIAIYIFSFFLGLGRLIGPHRTVFSGCKLSHVAPGG